MSAIDAATTHDADTEVERVTAQLAIDGMHCASCVARIERELQSVPGVHEAAVSLAAEEARVTFASSALDVRELERAVERAGYRARAKPEEPAEDEFARQDRDRAREHRTLMRKFWFSTVISIPVLVLSYPDLLGLDRWSMFAKGSDSLYWIWRALAVLTLPVLVWAASQFPGRGGKQRLPGHFFCCHLERLPSCLCCL